LECASQDQANFHGALVAVTAFPLVMAMALLIGFMAARKLASPGESLILLRSKFLSVGVLIAYMVLPLCTKYTFRTFVCETFDDGSERLMADYSIDCSSPTHHLFIGYAAVMVMVYPVGVPLFFFVLLYHRKARIDKKQSPASDQQVAPTPRTDSERNTRPISQVIRVQENDLAVLDQKQTSVGVVRTSSGTVVAEVSRAVSRHIDSKAVELDEWFFTLAHGSTGLVPHSAFWDGLLDVGFSWEQFPSEDLARQGIITTFDPTGKGGVELDDLIQTLDFEQKVDPNLKAVRFLFEDFKPRWWFWEVVVTVRRLLLTGVLVAFDRGSVTQIVTGILVALMFLLLQALTTPYASLGLNAIGLAADLDLFLVLFIGMLGSVDPSKFKGENGKALGALLIALVIAVLIVGLVCEGQQVANDIQDARDYRARRAHTKRHAASTEVVLDAESGVLVGCSPMEPPKSVIEHQAQHVGPGLEHHPGAEHSARKIAASPVGAVSPAKKPLRRPPNRNPLKPQSPQTSQANPSLTPARSILEIREAVHVCIEREHGDAADAEKSPAD